MKKLFVVFSLFLLLSAKAFCATENFSEYRNWRSTAVSGPQTNILVATGPVYIKDIEVDSAAIGSTFRFFNSTGFIGAVASTSPLYDTGNTTVLPYYRVLTPVTSGFAFTTTGNSTETIRWDWMYYVPGSSTPVYPGGAANYDRY